jgi:predicted secreted protein
MPAQYRREDRDIIVTGGEEFVIVLEANPTTGYQWEPEYDASLLQLVNREFSATDASVGSAATECFRWRALAAGTALIRFIYKRKWETSSADEIVFHISIGR